MGIEIEKKFTVKEIPFDLEKYSFHEIEQGYLNVHPAIRVRREDDIYYMTYKGTTGESDKSGNELKAEADTGEGNSKNYEKKDIGQVEYNMPLDKESYEHLSAKADGNFIRKRRYLIPINEDAYTQEYLNKNPELWEIVKNGSIKIELDLFKAPFDGRILAEVEFPSEEAARQYKAASWFDEDVTGDRKYSNSQMSREKLT